MDITVVDVETANSDYASICQIGLVRVRAGSVTETGVHLIDPEDDFAGINISIHGIRPDDVMGQPTLSRLWPAIEQHFASRYIVSYGPFDRTAISRALAKYNMPPIAAPWLDIMRLVRRVWPEHFAQAGYGLKNVCRFLEVPLINHHDALADAVAATQVLLKALDASSLTVDDAFARCQKPTRDSRDYRADFVGNPTADGVLTGDVVVFTGALAIPRRVAADCAKAAGAVVAGGVTKNTTLLVIGNQDVRRVGADGKSAKHVKAETLIEEGAEIRIMSEADFLTTVRGDF